MPKALITGITGQDGSYLAELLLAKGYEVHGVVRRSSSFKTDRIDHLRTRDDGQPAPFFLHYGDMSDHGSLIRLIDTHEPDEVYNLAAQSHVAVSFDQPSYTADVDALGALRMFECVRNYAARTGKPVRVYQAGSSEMFGATKAPQCETSHFHPRSPYAASKLAAHWFGIGYRESYGLFVSNGILFNHESPRRGENFVTRKITRAVGRIHAGLEDHVLLGNLDAKRDWGFAGDYVKAMWLMLQQDSPGDYVVATGEAHSVAEFCQAAFAHAGLNWQDHVRTDPRFLRPAEVDHLLGDSSKARQALGWEPEVRFDGLVKMMVDSDMKLARRERALVDAGHL
jgi:GDPmannose 4,6-dehydratase